MPDLADRDPVADTYAAQRLFHLTRLRLGCGLVVAALCWTAPSGSGGAGVLGLVGPVRSGPATTVATTVRLCPGRRAVRGGSGAEISSR
ncbi:hypothetical protein GCM10010193_00020 [Kitasatospora atroaurantiaca]